jgi:hypothetical protein
LYTKQGIKFYENIRIQEGIKERRCSVCQIWKPETEEYYYMKNKSKPEKGFKAECKECTIKNTQKYMKKNYDKMFNYIVQWQQDNRDKTLSYMREFYQSNKDERREYVKEWVNNNPERAKEYRNEHRDHDITDTEWKNCKAYFNNCCAYCGLPIEQHKILRNKKIIKMDLHKEHVDDNGANDLSNCIPGCQSCNSIKHLKSIDELLESKLIPNFTQDKYNKIKLWITEGHKQYIEEKPPYKITRKQNEGESTYHFELWSVDEQRNMIECLATADKKSGLNKYIKMLFKNPT